MPASSRIAILSDVHFAGPAERARRNDYEYRGLESRLQRTTCRLWRRHVWLRNPLDHGYLLDEFLSRVGDVDHVFALGDYSCDTAFVGVSYDASLESATLCLDRLRDRFGNRLHTLIGDHELGKFPMFGRRGGLRYKSWERVQHELALKPCWRLDLGSTVCIGVTSTLLMLPSYAKEMLPEEIEAWEAQRAEHLQDVRSTFESVPRDGSILLFCHDPTALPFLAEEESVRQRLGQIKQTFVGHLHSPLIFWQSRVLAGMPEIRFLGHTVKRLTHALARARHWRPFNVRLCPSLAGIELLKDGGFYRGELDHSAEGRFNFVRERIPR